VVKNTLLSCFYLLTDAGLLALLALPLFLDGSFTELAFYIGAGAVLLLLLFTALLVFQRNKFTSAITTFTLFYNDIVALLGLGLLYYMITHAFPYTLVLLIPDLLFLLCLIFLIDDLVRFKEASSRISPISIPKELLQEMTASSGAAKAPKEQTATSFDDFADYMEEEK